MGMRGAGDGSFDAAKATSDDSGTHDLIEAKLAAAMWANRPVCRPLFAAEQFTCRAVELAGVNCITPGRKGALHWRRSESIGRLSA